MAPPTVSQVREEESRGSAESESCGPEDETGTRARALVEAQRENEGGDDEGGGEGEVAGDHQVVRFGEDAGDGEGRLEAYGEMWGGV